MSLLYDEITNSNPSIYQNVLDFSDKIREYDNFYTNRYVYIEDKKKKLMNEINKINALTPPPKNNLIIQYCLNKFINISTYMFRTMAKVKNMKLFQHCFDLLLSQIQTGKTTNKKRTLEIIINQLIKARFTDTLMLILQNLSKNKYCEHLDIFIYSYYNAKCNKSEEITNFILSNINMNLISPENFKLIFQSKELTISETTDKIILSCIQNFNIERLMIIFTSLLSTNDYIGQSFSENELKIMIRRIIYVSSIFADELFDENMEDKNKIKFLASYFKNFENQNELSIIVTCFYQIHELIPIIKFLFYI